MNFNLINVGIAEMKIASDPDVLRTILGSCVAICLYDPIQKIGGMSHIMLPVARSNYGKENKYADTAIPLLINKLIEAGSVKDNLIAKIAGGAKIFKNTNDSLIGQIGESNILKVKEILKNENIDIIRADVGGDHGRTLDFYLANGDIKIKSLWEKKLIL